MDLDPKTRRTVLAIHEVYCLEERERLMWREYEIEEASQVEFNVDLLSPQDRAEYEQQIQLGPRRRKRKRNPEDREQHPASISTLANQEVTTACQPVQKGKEREREMAFFPTASEISVTSTISAGTEEAAAAARDRTCAKSGEDGVMPSVSPVLVQEIRRSIYEKYLETLQSFYNGHDLMSIGSLVMFPWCSPSIQRQMNVWVSGSTGSLKIVQSRRFQGCDHFFQDRAHIFEKLPDSLLFYRNTKIIPPRSMQKDHTIVISQLTYLFTVPFKKAMAANEVSTSGWNSLSLVEVELAGCNILYFNEQGMIEKDIAQLTFKSISDPLVSAQDIMAFMNFKQ